MEISFWHRQQQLSEQKNIPKETFCIIFGKNFEDSLVKANGCKMTQINPKSKKNEDEG